MIQKGVATLEKLNLEEDDRDVYHNNVDILFVLDTTSSMSSYIQQSKETIQKIIETFSSLEFNIKFSLSCYRDHPPQDNTYIFQFHDLVGGTSLIQTLQSVFAQGGGDGPEAVMDGLREGLSQTSWRISEDGVTKSRRFLFHIGDAPPHGQEYGGSSSNKDWQQNGCPCGTKKEDIAKLLDKFDVEYHLIKANHTVNLMEKAFQQAFGTHFSDTVDLNEGQQQQQQTTGFIFSPAPAVGTYKPSFASSAHPSFGSTFSSAPASAVNSFPTTSLFGSMPPPPTTFPPMLQQQQQQQKPQMMFAPAPQQQQQQQQMWSGVVGVLQKKLA